MCTSSRESGVIGHIGLSTHRPDVAQAAARSGKIEVIMFSVNPAFDLLPATTSLKRHSPSTTTTRSKAWTLFEPSSTRFCEREGVGLPS